jgi:hypothetical protein
VYDKRRAAADERESRVRELEEEVANLRAELEVERAARVADEAGAREQQRAEFEERDGVLREQLDNITGIMRNSQAELVRKREVFKVEAEERGARTRTRTRAG